MKKIVTLFLATLMVFVLSVSAFAELGGFVSSPSNNQAPELVEGKNESEDCVSQLIITAYANRDQISAEARIKIEAAYAMIRGAEDLSALNPGLVEIAKQNGVDVKSLVVSDLFDISPTDCDGHTEHGHFDITLKSETLKNFVCLLHYLNGEWVVVEGAQVTQNGEHLEFDEDEFSPFAIVIATEELTPVKTQEKDNNWVVIVACSVGGAAVIAGAIFGFVKFKKKKD